MSVIFLNNFLLITFLVLLPYSLQINHKHELSKMYFGILIEDNQNFSDIFIRDTLYNYIEENMPFQDPHRYETLYISLSDYRNFSGSFLKHFCELVERKIIIAILIFGDTSTTIITNFVSKYLQVPVVWARNSFSSFYTHSFFMDKNSLEVHLEPTPYELMKALRNLFIQTHWYKFKLLTDDSTMSSSLLVKDIWSILNSEPLNPTKISLPNNSLSQSLYRTLSQIAMSTRGILVLMCDYMMAKKVLKEAEALNMINKNFIWIWIETKLSGNKSFNEFPIGVLQIKPMKMQMTQKFIDNTLKVAVESLNNLFIDHPEFQLNAVLADFEINCWENHLHNSRSRFSRFLKNELEKKINDEIQKDFIKIRFDVLNLILNQNFSLKDEKKTWRKIGQITSNKTQLNTIVWPGGNIVTSSASSQIHKAFRIVTALAPPFVMEGNPDQDGQCLRGLICYRSWNNLTNETSNYNDDQIFNSDQFKKNCCYGLSIDLLENIANELEFQFYLYIVSDGLFGSRVYTRKKRFINLSANRPIRNFRHDSVFKTNYDFQMKFNFTNHAIHDFDTNIMWNGVVGDLISGTAHMSFTALSVTSIRSHVIDFSIPYYYGGVSFLASPKQKSDIPLMAFLLPFSTELWIAIFTSLNITAVAVAVYEWLSPFGLNPWGRQRSKNFSLSSALWVMWGLLCGHLVAFKAPKSWPNKFLINVWGGFSVIFIASYTANIAALIAGSFFHNTIGDYHDQSLLNQKIGSPKSSSAEWYVQNANGILWEHMKNYRLENIQEGIDRLKNGSLDIVLTDKPILDYYQATDHGCKLKKIGDTIFEDTYAIGMTKGFHLKDSISSIISKYSSNGYMDILQEKWFGGLPCFKMDTEMTQPRPLGIAAVTGVFILLLFGMVLGTVILISEHLFYKFSLPKLRHKPKDSIWRSRNIMFFSQKLYRFINCVELVSPHHAAKELINTLRQGQITSLFQKSVKRKEHEQTRRRRSKAQFFEMIQTIRRQQQEEKRRPLESVNEIYSENEHSARRKSHHSPNLLHRHFMRPKQTIDINQLENSVDNNLKNKTKLKSIQNLRRFSTEINIFSPLSALNLGRKLSRDNKTVNKNTLGLKNCPSPANSIDIAFLNREKKSPVLSIENLSLTEEVTDFKSYMKQENIGKKLALSPLNSQKTFIVSENVPQYPTIQISVHEEQDSNNNNLMLSLFKKLSSNELEVMLNTNDLQLREMILKAFQMKLDQNQT